MNMYYIHSDFSEISMVLLRKAKPDGWTRFCLSKKKNKWVVSSETFPSFLVGFGAFVLAGSILSESVL